LKYLIDTNIIIPLEPASKSDLELNSELAREFHRLSAKARYQLFVHPAIQYDLDRDKDRPRAELRRHLITKYNQLTNIPSINDRPLPPLEVPERGTNDWVDVNLLLALQMDAVDFLVTDDEDIHRKAIKIGLNERVLRLPDVVVAYLSWV
jgi:hypothetical protein